MIAVALLVVVLGAFGIMWNRRAVDNRPIRRAPPLHRHRTRRPSDNIRITPG
jgi:hypothetical protein